MQTPTDLTEAEAGLKNAYPLGLREAVKTQLDLLTVLGYRHLQATGTYPELAEAWLKVYRQCIAAYTGQQFEHSLLSLNLDVPCESQSFDRAVQLYIARHRR
jgi:hypothetical protein